MSTGRDVRVPDTSPEVPGVTDDAAAVADGTAVGAEGADGAGEAAGTLVETAGDEVAVVPNMGLGETRYGVTCTGAPIGPEHWLVDSATCGDRVMGLPSSVLVAGRTRNSGSIAVDMCIFLDAIIEGASRMCAIDGIVESSGIPAWAVRRLFGTFPVLQEVYNNAMDELVLTIEAAAYKAAVGMETRHTRRVRKIREGSDGESQKEETEETLDKYIPPDPALSKLILTSRMRGRYRDDGPGTQAVQINIVGPEANL